MSAIKINFKHLKPHIVHLLHSGSQFKIYVLQQLRLIMQKQKFQGCKSTSLRTTTRNKYLLLSLFWVIWSRASWSTSDAYNLNGLCISNIKIGITNLIFRIKLGNKQYCKRYTETKDLIVVIF